MIFFFKKNFNFNDQYTNQNLGFIFEREQIGTWHCHENSQSFKNLKLKLCKECKKKILAKYFLLYRQINYLRLIHKKQFYFPTKLTATNVGKTKVAVMWCILHSSILVYLARDIHQFPNSPIHDFFIEIFLSAMSLCRTSKD